MLLNLLVAGACIGVSVKFVLLKLGAPSWSYYVVLTGLALTLHFTNILLIRSFILKRAPEFASTERMGPDLQAWELTAGTGVVPRWVSLIGLAAVACVFALVFPAVAALFR